MKQLPPTLILKSDDSFTKFLKLVNKRITLKDFEKKGLSAEELNTCLKPFYKSMNKRRLLQYNLWLKNNHTNLCKSLKDLKTSKIIKCPNNVEEEMFFVKFCKVIKAFVKSPRDFDTLMLKKQKFIAEKLYSKKSKAKSRLAYIKKYVKDNYKRVKAAVCPIKPEIKKNFQDFSNEYCVDRSHESKSDTLKNKYETLIEIKNHIKDVMDTEDNTKKWSFNEPNSKGVYSPMYSKTRRSGGDSRAHLIPAADNSDMDIDVPASVSCRNAEQYLAILGISEQDLLGWSEQSLRSKAVTE